MDVQPTILVVEDDPATLFTVRNMLAQAKYQVLTAHDGAEAIKTASDLVQPIDLVLCDMILPDLRGDHVGETIRELRPDVRVMLMSGASLPASLLVMDNGWHFLAKPFVRSQLIKMLEAALAAPRTIAAGG